jgi:hypothetical protein
MKSKMSLALSIIFIVQLLNAAFVTVEILHGLPYQMRLTQNAAPDGGINHTDYPFLVIFFAGQVFSIAGCWSLAALAWIVRCWIVKK